MDRPIKTFSTKTGERLHDGAINTEATVDFFFFLAVLELKK